MNGVKKKYFIQIQVTSNGFNILSLEKLYRVLESVMAKYSDHWNRQELISVSRITDLIHNN